ncbi:tyrosine-type recombinase/integrase [Methanosarcina sp. T3]|uniref:tyrosine-type recombinase/integrase n=1 Tax=Methanosarcina sp. T3 TaxID=3439062 RepID=UPI003F8614A1
MKLSELRQDTTVKRWLNNLKPKRNTELAYLQALSAYTGYYNVTPYELIDEADKEEINQVRIRDRKIKDRLINFRSYLIDQGLADFTVRGRMAGIRSFYASFDIEIPKLQGERRRARVKEENREIPTKEDLQAALKVCDPLEKALVLTGVSSGLSSVEIQNLTINDFKKGYDPETEITTLKLRRVKTGVEFTTFLSPEASKAILEYLDFRNRDVKAATPKRAQQIEKQKVVSDSGYLFILRQVESKYLDTHDEEIRKLSENAVQKMYRAISDKARKNTSEGAYNTIRSHNMRKYFNSALLNAGCDSFMVEYWMGHELDDTRAAYFRASPEKLRDIYKKYIPYLTVQKELDISESPEYQQIKNENMILQAETARHIVERSELQDLRKEMQELKELEKNIPTLLQIVMQSPEAMEIMKNMKSQQKST